MYVYKACSNFRKRAIAFRVYTNQHNMGLSENHIVWNFMDMVIYAMKLIMPKVIFVFDRCFADEKLMKYMNHFDSDYIIRVPKNCGIVGLEYKGKLSLFDHLGYFKDVCYHIREQIKVNLLSAKNPSDGYDPFFAVSNVDDSLGLLYSR